MIPGASLSGHTAPPPTHPSHNLLSPLQQLPAFRLQRPTGREVPEHVPVSERTAPSHGVQGGLDLGGQMNGVGGGAGSGIKWGDGVGWSLQAGSGGSGSGSGGFSGGVGSNTAAGGGGNWAIVRGENLGRHYVMGWYPGSGSGSGLSGGMDSWGDQQASEAERSAHVRQKVRNKCDCHPPISPHEIPPHMRFHHMDHHSSFFNC